MPLADYLGLLLPHLDGALAGDAARSRIASLGSHLPGCAHGGFECRLAAGEDQVDLQINLRPGLPAFPEPWLRSAFWQRFQGFCTAWSEPDGAARHAVEDVWLEFDMNRTAGETPVPSVFLACRERGSAPLHVEQVVTALAGARAGAKAEDALARVDRALPANARVSHVGLMFSRPDGPMRINVAGIQATSFRDFLAALGWPGSNAETQIVADMVAPHCPRVSVALAIGPSGIEEAVGLECRPGDDASSGAAVAEQGLLDTLQAQRLCDPAKARGVLNWRGISWRARHDGAWPPELKWPDRLFSGSAESALARYLNHIKLTLRPDATVQAKAYLARRNQWLDRATLLAMIGAGAPQARGP